MGGLWILLDDAPQNIEAGGRTRKILGILTPGFEEIQRVGFTWGKKALEPLVTGKSSLRGRIDEGKGRGTRSRVPRLKGTRERGGSPATERVFYGG